MANETQECFIQLVLAHATGSEPDWKWAQDIVRGYAPDVVKIEVTPEMQIEHLNLQRMRVLSNINSLRDHIATLLGQHSALTVKINQLREKTQ